MLHKRIPGSLAIFVVVIVFMASCADTDKTRQEIATTLLDLEKEAITREFKNDTTFLSSLMDSTFIELSGAVLKNKHEVLETIYASNLKNEKEKLVRDSFKLNDPVVHVYGDAAVVTFVMKTFNQKSDSSFTRQTRFYDVWVKRGDDWKAVTWQGSPLDYQATSKIND